MAETIFDKILSGEIPCHKLYEDEQVLAFLDIAPLSFGHALVIPKERAATLDLLSDESSAAIGRVLPRLCRAISALRASAPSTCSRTTGRPRTKPSSTCTFTSSPTRRGVGPRHRLARHPEARPRAGGRAYGKDSGSAEELSFSRARRGSA